MAMTEDQLIALRESWADLPILNFWHDTNDAPDEFFDALLASSRGETPAEETAGTRTTVRTKTTDKEKEKATSSYTGAMSRGAKISKTPTKKGWGKFWKYVDPKGQTKLSEGRTGSLPSKAERAAGLDCVSMVVKKGLDLNIGYGKGARGTTAFEKGPVRGTSEYMKIDRKCKNCGNAWSVNADFKDTDGAKKCPKCRKSDDFKDVKGPYKQTGEVLLIPVGMVGDGQTVAFVLLTGAEASKMSFLKAGDRVCVRGWVKGQGYDASVASGLGLSGSGLKHYGYTFKKGGPTQAVPLITLGSRTYDGYIKKV
jgi:hypothetical protein